MTNSNKVTREHAAERLSWLRAEGPGFTKLRATDLTAIDLAISALREADAAPIVDLARKYLDSMTCDACMEHPVNACAAPVESRPCQSCAEWKSGSEKLALFCRARETTQRLLQASE